MVNRIFGDMLYCPQSDSELKFPPESLKEKIMISTKPPENPAHERVKERQISKDSAEESWDRHSSAEEKEHDSSDEVRMEKITFYFYA